MNRWVAGQVIWPWTERLRGRDTMRRLCCLLRTDTASADELHHLQNTKLRMLLKLAEEHCPFYARRFRDANLDPRDPHLTLESLRALPTLRRDDIRENLDELTWSSAQPAPAGPPVPHHTGGSTGEPLKFHIDRARQSADWAARFRARSWWRVQPGDPEMLFWGTPFKYGLVERLRRVRDGLLNQHIFSAFEMNEQRVHAYLRRMAQIGPRCIYGYATSVALIARHARERGFPNIQHATRRLRAVFVTGETLLDQDRALIATTFGVPVVNEYGARDAGLMALQCPQGTLHVPQENVVVEILDTHSDRPAAPGELGEVTVTYLENFAMPFIRYRVGDLSRQGVHLSKPCACGRSHMRLDDLHGRVTDQIVTRQGDRMTRMHALSLIYVLREVEGIRQFRVIQNTIDSLDVELVAGDAFTPQRERGLVAALQERLGPHVDIHIHRTRAIPASRSGKHACVVSHVA